MGQVWLLRKGLGEAAWLEERSHLYTDQQAGGGQLRLYARDRNKKTSISEHSKENVHQVETTHNLLPQLIKYEKPDA